MLFVLTGKIQTGKTRWLQGTLADLAEIGVKAFGVVAPGRWREAAGADGGISYEKLGIDNVLLPGGVTVPFATRRDLVARGSYDATCTQASRLQLGWAISDEAISRVNGHFATLAQSSSPGRGLLVVDELGRLEVERGLGLTEALALLEAGPGPCWQHALVVARADLAGTVEERFSPAWGSCARLHPDNAALETLLAAFGT